MNRILNSMNKTRLHIIRIFTLLLMLLGGTIQEIQATDVTYHILTLPINNSIYHMKDDLSGKRLEAVKVVVKGQATLELPVQYKSPLATGFTYYKASDVTPSSVVQLYQDNTKIKGVYYTIGGSAEAVGEGTAVSGSTAEYYVVYTYNTSNTIAKLDGTHYNIRTKYKDKGAWKDKGFFAYNRGRNNRPAILPTANVNPEMLASEDFMKAPVTGTKVGTYWQDNNNKNIKEDVESQFHFIFKFEGLDPYNIIIRTAYAKDSTYIEKNDGTNTFVYKWYKEGSLFAVSSGNNAYIASDEHKLYNYIYNSGIYPNPTILTEGTGTGYTTRNGNYHGQTGVVWNSFALLNNSDNSGYVFMGTRTVDGNGATQNSLYYLKEKDSYNNLNFNTGNSSDNLSIEGIYPIEKVTFKVATPFYDPLTPTAHIISVEDKVSKYTVDNDPIETKYLPSALKRKYCNFNGKFYSDAECTHEITHFSQATNDPTEGYQVYVGYDVAADAPDFLSPSASYTTATWYELTDAGSTQEYGRKIKNNSGTYKNNGANGEYTKESEFAFVGDPYEVKVLYREDERYVTLSDKSVWDIPDDDTAGSFLLRKFNDTGYWSWNAGQVSADVAYGSNSSLSVGKDAQTITINLSGLNGGKYYKITTGGAGVSQIVSVDPRAGYVYKETATTATIAISLAENTSDPLSDQTITITIQEYDDNEGNTPSPASSSVITITQGTASSAFEGNVVTYSTTSSTRVKVLELPTRTFTYNIVDKSGRIAIKASAEQTIFSALSLASIPSIIVSPFILEETVTFYDDAYTDNNGRGTLVSVISETPNTDHDIFVKYTTSALDANPFKLSEDQEIFVRLNGQYIFYEDGVIKTSAAYENNDKYKWKLRNRDPYNMLIDNMAARTALGVADQSETPDIYDDDGAKTTPSRQKGAWVWLNDVALPATSDGTALAFITDRKKAGHFIAKSSTAMGVYEVMVAAGDAIDASTTYYNIGRPADNTVKIYNNTTYAHGNPVLAFRLEQSAEYTYHLIDKAKHELLTVKSKSPELVLPAEYQSPLVGTYNYYGEENITITGDIYEPTDASVKIDNLDAVYTKNSGDYSSQWTAADSDHKKTAIDATDVDTQAKELKVTGHVYFKIGETSTYYDVNVTKPFHGDIYVTYVANDIVTFNTGSYMLKFLEPHADGYYLEDGNDKLTNSKIKAVYPYCNGDGNLNIYGTAMNEEQMKGGASTRPRWIWYFASENDPYHVAIRSRSTISYNGISNPTYLTTYVVHFNQDAEGVKKVVTGGTLPGIASVDPTEYMILGSQGNYKLLTTQKIDDGTTIERRQVTSLEQYWKTYNMIKKDVLAIDVKDDPTYKDAYSDDELTWVVPTEKRSDLENALDEKGVGTGQWHSYDAYANATRWNGYNDKTDGHEKKVVEKVEHWFQTFDMGNGTFDIESADIPPVLVLLDLHGWEIMRLPLPTANYPEGDDELAALRAYDSPMVDKYYFYSNATKASGCHKYSLRLDDKGKERDQILYNGEHYTSTSLADLPPASAKGVKDNTGVFNDQFVTYTVKEEYAKSYDYTYNESTYAETEYPSKFLVVQHGRYYKTENNTNLSYITKPIIEHTNPEGGNVYDMILNPKNHTGNNNIVDGSGHWIGNCLWYIKPNQNIDKEMGIKYAAEAGSTGEPWTELEYKKYYYDNGKAGFDPYNLQIQLLKKNDGTDDLRYLSSHITSTHLDNGIMKGDYLGSTTYITLETGFIYAGVDPLVSTGSEGYDHTNIKMSNQTFMAVSDANGNMQLMPRFDHTKRVDLDNVSPWETTLEDPVNHPKASASDNASMGSQTTFFVRPQVFEYQIIDNDGNESIRYKRAGDYYPAITEHFKSPLATDFKYYKTRPSYDSETNTLNVTDEITGSFASAGVTSDNPTIYVRYSYDADADHDGDKILEGKWFTVKLANQDLQADGEVMTFTRTVVDDMAYTTAKGALSSDGVYYFRIGTSSYTYQKVTRSEGIITGEEVISETDWSNALGLGVSLYSGTKPETIDEDDKTWQWKFLAAPMDPESEYYIAPDPYAIQIFNRSANYATNLAQPSPMSVGIKVPNADNGADRFALLSHTEGGYALAVAGTGAYTYTFVNGADMTTPDAAEPKAATTVTEANFTQKAGGFSGVGSQLLVNNDVEHNFEYKVINNASKFAINARQDKESAEAYQFYPYLPETAQTPLLNMEDYKYYGFATVDGKETVDTGDDTYSVDGNTKLFVLYGLYDDVVYVRYEDYSMDKTEFKVPNKRNDTSPVERHSDSHDVSINIKGGLPYNIIWKSDNMMQSTDNTNISDGGKQSLSGNQQYVWYFTGGDPYALKIKHKGGKYVDGNAALADNADNAMQFMLLKKTGYDYGILQVTGTMGDAARRLTGFGGALTSDASTDPNQFIIFGLSVHDLIYHLIIAKTCTKAEEDDQNLDTSKYVDIPYMTEESGTPGTKRIYGSTQRDLTSKNSEEGLPGEKYQLGETVTWGGTGHIYSYDAGSVSIGDVLEVPNVFSRPNCTYEYYVEGIYSTDGTESESSLDEKFKGLKVDKLMPYAELIDKTVVVNIVYSFDKTVATNTGMDFVRSINDKCWYTYETQGGGTPYLAHYTNAWGMQSMAGRETRYTNDYLWTPLGDVYGFKLYNRYMIKNSEGSNKVMTFAGEVGNNKKLVVAEPSPLENPTVYTAGNEIFELLTGDNPNSGYFRVHPVVNTKEQTQYYVKRNDTPGDIDGDRQDDLDYTILSTTPCDWAFGLDVSLMEPYYERAGYVGGLKPEGKEAYETAVNSGTIMDIQHVVFDDANIIEFTSGYYRLHNQPGVSGINPVRYASGYLHDIEQTAGSEGRPIPMHFYSRKEVATTFSELGTGNYTETHATRGDIPIAPTEYDPSTIFYINGSVTGNKTISEAYMSTQGLRVSGNTMSEGDGIHFTLIDIGGATLLIASELDPAQRNYFNFAQTSSIYDLKYMHECPTDDAKWCLQPVQKGVTAGNGEMPLQIATNQGGDGHYYATFYAPFDVLLPNDADGKTYYAYICRTWNDNGMNSEKVPASSSYTEGKFVPAGTPVIIRTTDESNIVTLALPSTSPTASSITTDLKGTYLEQLLALDTSHDAYTFGLPFTSDATIDRSTGVVTAPLKESATTGVGFYINATPNKEHDALQSLWQRNNRYVLHNKIYYRAEGLGSGTRGVEFVPVIFDDEEGLDERQAERTTMLNDRTVESVGDGCVYDLQGRKVATKQQVEDGTWRQNLRPGIYIINGKKFKK